MFILCLIARWYQLFISVLMQLPVGWCWHVPNRPPETGGLGVHGTQLLQEMVTGACGHWPSLDSPAVSLKLKQ